jgi:hypothetical protein
LKCQSRDEHEEDGEEEGPEDRGVEDFVGLTMDVAICSWGHSYHEDSFGKLVQLTFKCGIILTELDDYFSEVVRMPRPTEESLVANRRLITIPHLEQIFLHITNTLHRQPNSIQNNTRDVSTCAKSWLRVSGYIRRVQDGDRQGDSPHPDHLEYPESKEWKELVALIVEAVVFAGLNDSEKQKSRESKPPDHDEERDYDLAGIVMSAECKCYNS